MLFRYAEEYPAINGGDEFGMNYIFTNRNKNSGLQAAVFYSAMPDGVWHEKYSSLQNKTHEVRLINVKNVSNVKNR